MLGLISVVAAAWCTECRNAEDVHLGIRKQLTAQDDHVFCSLSFRVQPGCTCHQPSMWAPMAAIASMHLLVLALLLPSRAHAQDTNLTVSNQVCKKGDWKVSGWFCS